MSFLFSLLNSGSAKCGETLQFPGFGTVSLYGGTENPGHVVLFVSGDGGWNKGVVDMAGALASDDTLVVGIDIVHYLKSLSTSKEACVYPAGDLETLAKYVQEKLGLAAYHPPILVGYSSGATLVYTALVEAPKSFPGAVSLGFCPDLNIKKPLCKGDGLEHKTGPKGKGFIFLPKKSLKTPWIVLQGDIDQVCNPVETKDFVNQVGSARLIKLPKVGHGFSVQKNWMPQFKDAIREIEGHDTTPRSVAKAVADTESNAVVETGDLPLVELPNASSHGNLMAVIISGDGGWASIDSEMGERLSAAGIPVVGLDSLKYFWKSKTPDVAAADLKRIIMYYSDAWNKKEFLLIGYSRGADVLPFMVSRLPKELRNRVRLLVFLGLSDKVSFEFHLSDWIAGKSRSTDLPIEPEIEKLRGIKMLCICGRSENNSLCRKLDRGLAETVLLKGGHHFGGDYEGIIEQVLTKLN